MLTTWVLVAIGALLFVHVLFVALALHRAGWHATRGVDTGVVTGVAASDDGASRSHDDRTVQCQNCGTTNEAQYRYCRKCVSKLPTGVSLRTAGSRAESRRGV
jgi:hypothetical protein